MATYWVAACVAVNNFSLACEDDEQADDEDECYGSVEYCMYEYSNESII